MINDECWMMNADAVVINFVATINSSVIKDDIGKNRLNAIHNSPFTIHHSPFTIHHLQLTTIENQIETRNKILIGLEKAYKRLIEFKKLKNTELVIIRDNKIVKIKLL
ncbi:hypothetical protein BH11BAC5_BH11BAC5_29950 [soil metagenome]